MNACEQSESKSSSSEEKIPFSSSRLSPVSSCSTISEEEIGERRRNRRELLRQYYSKLSEGLETAEDEEGAMLDIDSPRFDVNAFVSLVLKQKTLRELIKLDKRLVSEIRLLDEEIQTLIYQNYSKFLSATDTVRQMKGKIEHIEAEMSRLNEKMIAIKDLNSKIDSSLAENRLKVFRLSSVHVLLKKLRFLFELPGRLKKSIEASAYRQAVDYYCKTHGILLRYEHISSFSGIRDECQALLVQLKDALHSRLSYEKNVSLSQLTEAAELLLLLDAPPAEIAESYLLSAHEAISCAMGVLESNVDHDPHSSHPSLEHSLPIIIQHMKTLLRGHQTLFGEEKGEQLRSTLGRLFGRLLSTLKKTILCSLEQNPPVEGDLLIKDINSLYVCLTEPDVFFYQESWVKERFTSFVEKMLESIIEFTLEGILRIFEERIMEIKKILLDSKPSSKPLSQLSDDLSVDMKALVLSTITLLLELSQKDNRLFTIRKLCRRYYKKHVLDHFLASYFVKTTERCKVLAGTNSLTVSWPLEGSSLLILVLAGYLFGLEKYGLPFLYQETLKRISMFKVDATGKQQECLAIVKNGAQELVNCYSRIYGNNVSALSLESLAAADWLTDRPPTAVRAATKGLITKLSNVATELDAFFGADIKSSLNVNEHRTTPSMSLTTNHYMQNGFGINNNFHKLFTDRIDIYKNVEFSKSSIMKSIILVYLKAFMEEIRLCVLSTAGMQQVQLDVECLRRHLSKFFTDGRLLNFFLDEILDSCAKRCLRPVPLEKQVVKTLLMV
ncbi:vacuolar protein sorting-associated protein 51 homolog isoform X2 [Zophobas morio]|uniref:vacuolar protein sorting-associated protein 51 homolog isoform X2 n=1 Tax=Zophobas morio TaxID=2755281 RepID=UPI0030830854